jgi:hypothetical protein
MPETVYVKRVNGMVSEFRRLRCPDMTGWEAIAEDHPDVVAFNSKSPFPDFSITDNQTRAVKTLALMIGQVGGLTVAQTKALFKSKWDLAG